MNRLMSFLKFNKSSELIQLNISIIEKLIEDNTDLEKILKYVKTYVDDFYGEDSGNGEDGEDYPDNYIVFNDITDEESDKLKELGFGVKIYDDSNEYSNDFRDKYKISWDWK